MGTNAISGGALAHASTAEEPNRLELHAWCAANTSAPQLAFLLVVQVSYVACYKYNCACEKR